MRSHRIVCLVLLGLVTLLVGWIAIAPGHVLERNLYALNTLRRVRLIQDVGNCPELALTLESTIAPEQEPNDNSRQNFFTGILALAAGQPESAYGYFEHMLETKSPDLLDSFWLGCAALATGDLETAIEHWRAGGLAPYFANHGDSAFNSGDYVTALRLYERAAAVTPDSARAWLGMTASLLNLASAQQADWEDMLAKAEHTLTLAPDNPHAHYLVGYALFFLNSDLPRAEGELRWALEHRRYWGDAYVLARLLLERGR